jgi:hypothetical protein
VSAATGHPSHADAIADTGEGYSLAKGWHVSCLWCDWSATRRTGAEAEAAYRAHERRALDDEGRRPEVSR